jgi:ankyrin repeat protein
MESVSPVCPEYEGDDRLTETARNKNEAIRRFVAAMDVNTIESMLSDGSIDDVDVVDPQTGFTCLHNSAWYGLLDNMRFLLSREKKANINSANRDGHTPLIRAVYNNQPDACKLLIDFKADKGLRTTKHNGNQPFKTALDIAKFCRHRECELILEKYDPNQKQKIAAKSPADKLDADGDLSSSGNNSSAASASSSTNTKAGKVVKDSTWARTAKKIVVLTIIVILVAFIMQNIINGSNDDNESKPGASQ